MFKLLYRYYKYLEWDALIIKKFISIISIVCMVSMAVVLSGCSGSMNASNNNSNNKAIDSWNSLIVIQTGLNSKATNTMTLMGEHFNTYINESNQNSQNYDLLISDYQTDKNNLQTWDPDLSNLNTAIQDFSSNTTDLTGNSKLDADKAVTDIRTYHTNMQNAETAYIAYCDNMINYIKSAKNGNPDALLLQAGNSKKGEGIIDIQNAFAAMNQAADSMKSLG